jgi:hypothetical protein
MKKILIAFLAVASLTAFAADTLITGFDATTGIGTFKVVSDGTSATLTVDKLVVSTGVTNPGGVTETTSITTGITAFAYATNLVATVVTNTLIYLDASTNAATNVTYSTTYAVATHTPVVKNSAAGFVSGVCTNAP